MAEVWPVSVSYKALSDTMSVVPFAAPLATDMEDGQPRTRRSTTKNRAPVKFTVRMTNAQFATFKAWVRDALVDGVLPFTMMVWTGGDYQDRTCRFTDPYQDDPSEGMRHDVSLSLDVEDY